MNAEIIPFLFAGVLLVLTIVMVVVGVYVVMLLRELRAVIMQVQLILMRTEQTISMFSQPFHQVAGISAGLHTGFKVFEGFLEWLEKSRRQ